MEPDSRPIEFTLAELWMLNDVIRHDEDDIPKKKWPKVSTSLNGDIALAILACEDSDLKSYRQIALAERRRYWFGVFGITPKSWKTGKWSLWDVKSIPYPNGYEMRNLYG